MAVRRRPTLVLTVFLILLLTLFAGVMPATTAQDERVLVVGWSEITDSLDPANGFTQTTSVVHKAVYEGLVTFPAADASAIEPALASEWEISDDGTVYTFTLRDAVFSNGDPVTADDVVFPIERLQNLDGNPSFLADVIAGVEAIDERTVAFTLPTATPGFLATLTNNPFSVTNADAIMENGGTGEAGSDTAEDWLSSDILQPNLSHDVSITTEHQEPCP
jgi:peptide/nickel transport system substrate-binding protein